MNKIIYIYILINNIIIKMFIFYNNFKDLYCLIDDIDNKKKIFQKNSYEKNYCINKYKNITKALIEINAIDGTNELKKITELIKNRKKELEKKISKHIDIPYKEIYYSNINCEIIPNFCKEYNYF